MSRLGLGCVRLGSVAAGLGHAASVRLVHHALDHGVTYFDTADAYGSGASEALLGHALRGRRDRATIATKGGYRFEARSALEQRARLAVAGVSKRLGRGRSSSPTPPALGAPASAPGGAYASQDFSEASLTAALDGSLRRLGTDHIDVYQLHGPRGVHPDDLSDWAGRMIASGKVGRLGVGAEDRDQASAWADSSVISSIQLPFGLLDPDLGVDVIPAAAAVGTSVVARGVLGAGLLVGAAEPPPHQRATVDATRRLAAECGVPVTQLALWYVLARPEPGMVDTVLVGASSAKHLDEAVAAVRAQAPGSALLDSLDRIANEQLDANRGR